MSTSNGKDRQLKSLEELCAQDPGKRGISNLVQPGHLAGAAKSLLEATRVLIVSGFYIPRAQAGETDGPPGAVALGTALKSLGIETTYATDEPNRQCLACLGASPLQIYSEDFLREYQPSHLLSIERVGRAADGRYYSMRGEDITPTTAPMDQWFLDAQAMGITTIAIGDGGNEIGMGRVFDLTKANVLNGQTIACVVSTDFLITSGVSNWGGYALVAALSVLAGKDLLPDKKLITSQIESLSRAGAVDGVTLQQTETVDGLPIGHTIDFTYQLKKVCNLDA